MELKAFKTFAKNHVSNYFPFFTLLLFLIILTAYNSFGKDVDSLKAIHRKDNSFVTYKDSISPRVKIPLFVREKIDGLYKKLKDSVTYKNDDGSQRIIFNIYVNNRIDLYIIKAYSFNSIHYYFLLADKIERKVSENIPSINGKWMENNEEGFEGSNRLLTKPLLYFKNLPDGKRYLFIKQRAHNGNLYNAVIDHMFSIDTHLNFERVFCFESVCLDSFDNCLITRKLNKNVLSVDIKCNNTKTKKIAEVSLDFLSKKKIINKKVYLSKYAESIISGSVVDDEEFLKNGYTLNY